MITEEDLNRWNYNCKDVDYTFQIAEILEKELAEETKLNEFALFQQQELVPVVQHMMERGVRIDLEQKEHLRTQLTQLSKEVRDKLEYLVGEPYNPASPPQNKAVFLDLLKIKPVLSKQSKQPTFGSEALVSYLEDYPEYKVFLTLILEYRSINVFLNTFVKAEVDIDGRMRCSYNVAGTSTYRLASRKNVFGTGANLQNLPSKGKIDLRYSLETIDQEEETSIIHEVETITELPNCKKFFIPDEGYTFFDVDYSGADAMVVAWDSDCQWLQNFFLTQKKKLYIYIGEQYLQEEMTTKHTMYKKFKQLIHLCLTGEHEVLTKTGWVRLDEYDRKSEIAVWDIKTENIFFEKPANFTESFVDSDEPLYRIKGSSFDQITTLDHKFPYKIDKTGYKTTQACLLPRSARLPYTGNYLGGKFQLENDFVRLICALQADGHIQHTDKKDSSTVIWHFRRQKKIDRLIKLLKSCGIEYNYRELTYKNKKDIYISCKGAFKPFMKSPDAWMLELSAENIKTFVDELWFWDGHKRTSNGVRTSVYTTIKENAIWYQTLIQLTGKGSKIRIATYKNSYICYEVSINNRKLYRKGCGINGPVLHKGTKVYCPTTSTGFFMVRHNEHIMVTGNTNYGGKAEKAAISAGIPIQDAKRIQKLYFNLCPELPEWHKRLASEAKTRGYIENIFGARGYFLNRNDPTFLNKVYAWLPQSTIAILVNKGIVNITKNEKDVEVLLQTHDSASGQFPIIDLTAKGRILKHMAIELPYKKSLIIPADIKTSTISYGDCD